MHVLKSVLSQTTALLNEGLETALTLDGGSSSMLINRLERRTYRNQSTWRARTLGSTQCRTL